MKSVKSFCVFLFLVLLYGFSVPKELSKRALKEVEKTFEETNFATAPISVSDEINAMLPTKITGENLYRIQMGTSQLGYAFFDEAPSKTAAFDYLVLFDEELKIINTKVLVYREEYGGEIGSKRWLKQFLGKTGGDKVSVKENIDVISGATISVNSMTRAMDNLLATIGILQEKGKL